MAILAMLSAVLSSRTRSQANKRPATGSPSPAPSEPSDTNMVDSGLTADLVWGRLAPRLDATHKKADERHKELHDEIAGIKADSLRKDAQIEGLTNKNTAMETRLERLEQASRANNIMLFNILTSCLVRVQSTA